MKKKAYMIPIIAALALVLLISIGVATAMRRSWGISVGRYLLCDSGTSMLILDESPIQMSDRTKRDLFDGLETGDKIWVLHNGIAESYPAKTIVYAVIRVGKGSIDDIPTDVLKALRELGWLYKDTESGETKLEQVPTATEPEVMQTETTERETEQSSITQKTTDPSAALKQAAELAKEELRDALESKYREQTTAHVVDEPKQPVNQLDPTNYEVTICYSNWCEMPTVFQKALNTMRGTPNTTIDNLPVFKFDTVSDLVQFEQAFASMFSFGTGYDEMPSFQEVKGAFDEAFFEKNTLVLVYVESGSGSYRYGVKDIYCDDSAMLIRVETRNHPMIITADMAGWFLMVTLPDDLMSGILSFDAEHVRAN